MPKAKGRSRQMQEELGYLARRAKDASQEGEKSAAISLDAEGFPVGLTNQQKDIIRLIQGDNILENIASRMNLSIEDTLDEIVCLIVQRGVIRRKAGEGIETRYETTYK